MSEEKALQIVEQPFNEAMTKSTPYSAMLAGKEEAYETCLALAIKATKPQDWVDYGGSPFLQEPGARRIAMRFGISLMFDRDEKGHIVFAREDFQDELGPIVKYRVSGKAQIGNHTVEGIGSASSRDDFLGWEWIDRNDKDKGKRPKPLYAVLEDVEKKAATNLFSNLIKAILAIKGFTWDDLAKYGISKEGKKGFEFKTKPRAPSAPRQEPQIDTEARTDKKPFWDWQAPDGKHLCFARLGKHFDMDFMKAHNMKPSRSDPKTFVCDYSDGLMEELTTHFEEKEMEL